ncbi:hypothetical protein QA584_12710 [Anaerocolumna sp. AGMB13025]|uniref:hypothetical protein n=1 Tax=Anaerocolumna sp. AGMB13025 TaxID=3039116 RepID=UPI00241F5C3F|nr:hypothetical protein [Anaerocolumna sp. AGMB13025]WFR59901.1 hypothetical protein QA584_12710 [Anaerocolumna sp. AGMB13025]
MKITGTNEYYNTNASSEKSSTLKKGTELNMANVFKDEVVNWKEKIKLKLTEELENDEEQNIKMSDKQWRSLIAKVDSAINKHKLNVKMNAEKAVNADPKDEEKN